MASKDVSVPLFTEKEDAKLNRRFDKWSKFPTKWIIIGLFIFFFFILLVLITALCLVFIEVMSVQQQQQQPLSIAKINPNLIYKLEDVSKEEPVPIKDIAKSEPLVPTEADGSQLVQQPTDQQVELGKEAILDCKFDHKVHCRWLRKLNLVDISTRYSYIEAKQDDGNFDCSIKITNIKSIDLNEWQCVGVFNDQSSLPSNTVKLQTREQTEVVMVIPPKDAKAELGEDVRLDCKFNQKVNCAWMRRGEHIEIQGRYKFIEKSDGSDEQRSDCSIKISKVKTIDAGDWMCSSMADSNSAGLTSSAATLTLTG